MRGAVYVNGKIAPADQAVVPVYDHGFVYGEGVYETLRTYNRVPFLYDRHMRRLRQSADRLLLDVPFDDATMLQWIDQTVAAAGRAQRGLHPHPADARRRRSQLRPEVDAHADDRDHRQAARGASRARVQRRDPDLARRHARNHPKSVNPIIKSNNLLNNALAMQAAYRAGAEEALMCNYRGELTECSQANFFMVRGGAALTPKSAAGLLEGVTRAFIFELGRELGIDVREEVLLPKDLETRGRDVHHVHDARAEPRRQRRRPRRRVGQARPRDQEAAGALSAPGAGADAIADHQALSRSA